MVDRSADGVASRGRLGAQQRDRNRLPALAVVVRVVAYALTAAVIAWPLAVPGAVLAALLGGALGALGGVALASSSLRLLSIAGLLVVALLSVAGLHGWWLTATWPAHWLGAAGAVRVAEAFAFGMGSLFAGALLSAASCRRPAAAGFELAVVGLAFGQLFVAHRNGAIHRPFEIADPVLSMGGDPTLVFLAVGVVATGVVALLLLSERSLLRAIVHLAVVALLLSVIVWSASTSGLPGPPPTGGGLGLRGEGDPDRKGSKGGQSGGRRQNEELEFRDQYNSDANQVPVGIVLLEDDYSPPTGVYYLRQGAFSQYNGRRLIASTRADVDRDIARGFPSAPTPIDWTPPAGQYRAPLETTVALLAEHTRPFALEAPVSLEPAPNPNPGRFKRTYRVTSAVLSSDYFGLLGLAAGSKAWSSEQWAHYTTAPPDPRYQQLTEKIFSEALPEQLGDEAIVRALTISAWLSKKGTYSLKSRHAKASDPTADFLFGDKTGYCVHFAHAAAYMMRSVGLPARVSTGYAIDEASRQGGSALLITGQSSHAWPEVYLEGVGWVVVDVTPETVLEGQAPPPDPELQRLLAEMLRGEQPVPRPGAVDLPQVASSLADLGQLAWRVAAALGVVLLLFLVLAKLWRRLAPRLGRWLGWDAKLPRLAYRAALDLLSEVHVRRHSGESRATFARRIRAQAPSFTRLTALHSAAAFGSVRVPSGPSDAGALLKSVGTERRRAMPTWQRALGWATPWSWLRSR